MSRRVLIVEDEIIVADDLEWQLRKMGYNVLGVAASGEEALSAITVQKPEIVLMDIQLQGAMNGIQVATLIQEKTGAAIIFVTAFPAVFLRDPRQMRPPGICLSKPFSPVQLRAALESVVSRPE
jgi:DNA-binding response OmpR family regulator